jgi:hypothetical protein
MNVLSMKCVLLVLSALPAFAQPTVDRVLPALAAGKTCTSTIQLQNLGDRTVTIALEAYDENGALVALKDHPAIALDLAPSQREIYHVDLPDETAAAWARVRETLAAARASPVVTVSGSTECVDGNELRTVTRQVAFPMRNPWFEGDVSELPGDLLALVNTSAQPATALLCYSAAAFYSVPDGRRGGELTPVCIASSQVQVPPFSARQFPVERDGSKHFSLRTRGAAIVLQMLRPQGNHVKIYAVDSSIKFGAEVVDQ